MVRNINDNKFSPIWSHGPQLPSVLDETVVRETGMRQRDIGNEIEEGFNDSCDDKEGE